jgi:anti-anti-sigma factor
MSIEQKINGDVGTLILTDEIDLDTSPTVRENIKELLSQTKTVEVNLSKVSYIDSSGVASLIEGMQMAKQQSGKEFFLTEVSNEVMKVIELAHLDKIFSIKNKTGTNALEGGAIQENIPEKEEPSASENIDLEVSEKNASEAETTKSDNDTSQEESSPRVSRDDNNADDDKIKFKR